MRSWTANLLLLLAACSAAHPGGDGGAPSGNTGAATGGSSSGGATACQIGGSTLEQGVKNPANRCQYCDPSLSTTSWTLQSCAAETVCAQGRCVPIGCTIDGVPFATNELNPENPCEVCDPEDAGASAWTLLTGLLAADAGCGNICFAGSCLTGCLVDGSAFDAGTFESQVACAICDPAAAPEAWTPFSGTPPAGMCPSGDGCVDGGCVCLPQCVGVCPHAPDGCGGTCPVPAVYPGCVTGGAEGCCDENGVCQPGNTAAACTVGGACQSCASTESCAPARDGGTFCCTPGTGCGYSCGDPSLLDACGNPCPFACPANRCCDAHGDCQPGTANAACGSGGAPNSCAACTGLLYCGSAQSCTCTDGTSNLTPCSGNCTSGEHGQTCQNGQVVDVQCLGCPPGKICQISGVCG